jgi:hypothetical protein
VNPNNRFGTYVSPEGRLGEVNSGDWWYNTAYSNLVKDPDNHFPCPIIFTMDNMVISEMGDGWSPETVRWLQRLGRYLLW